jgi:hypothetical protein
MNTALPRPTASVFMDSGFRRNDRRVSFGNGKRLAAFHDRS